MEILADNLDQFATVFYFYNGPALPAGVFDKFLALPYSSDTTTTQSYSDLVSSYHPLSMNLRDDTDTKKLILNAGISSIFGLRYALRVSGRSVNV